MASKVAASAMGGGSFLSRAVSGLVSKQISWDNKEQLESILMAVKRELLTNYILSYAH